MLFSSGRKVLDFSLPLDEFERRAVFFRDCIVRCRSTNLERRAVFLKEERPCLFIIAQLDVLFDFPPLNEFGTSCCLLTLSLTARLSVLLISRRSTGWNVVLVFSERKEFSCESSLN